MSESGATDPTRVFICPQCGRVASVAPWNKRPICVHAWEGNGGPEIWDGEDTDGNGRKIEESPNGSFRVPGGDTWAQMVRYHDALEDVRRHGI